jgi:hypothetical protein
LSDEQLELLFSFEQGIATDETIDLLFSFGLLDTEPVDTPVLQLFDNKQ